MITEELGFTRVVPRPLEHSIKGTFRVICKQIHCIWVLRWVISQFCNFKGLKVCSTKIFIQKFIFLKSRPIGFISAFLHTGTIQCNGSFDHLKLIQPMKKLLCRWWGHWYWLRYLLKFEIFRFQNIECRNFKKKLFLVGAVSVWYLHAPLKSLALSFYSVDPSLCASHLKCFILVHSVFKTKHLRCLKRRFDLGQELVLLSTTTAYDYD